MKWVLFVLALSCAAKQKPKETCAALQLVSGEIRLVATRNEPSEYATLEVDGGVLSTRLVVSRSGDCIADHAFETHSVVVGTSRKSATIEDFLVKKFAYGETLQFYDRDWSCGCAVAEK